MEKDRFGDKLRDKEKAEEDRYFAERDRELLKKMKPKPEAAPPRMLCPKCGGPLKELTFRNVLIDECAGCGGIWLDRGELEVLTGPGKAGWIAAFLGRKKKGS